MFKFKNLTCYLLHFRLNFPPDILRSLLLQRTLCKWAQHFSQSAGANPRVPGHERQPGVVAGWSRRTPGVCPVKLHPQIWVHMNHSLPQTTPNPTDQLQTHYKRTFLCLNYSGEMHWCGEMLKKNTLHIDTFTQWM